MELQTNEIYSKGFFFSGDLNINRGLFEKSQE